MEIADGIKHKDNYKQQPNRCKCNTTLKAGHRAVHTCNRNTAYHQCCLQNMPPISKARIIFPKQNFSK